MQAAVLGFIFVIKVAESLEMPTFSDTLLGLVGLSNGAYLGFKLPELQRRVSKGRRREERGAPEKA